MYIKYFNRNTWILNLPFFRLDDLLKLLKLLEIDTLLSFSKVR